jgi:mannitol-1-/sugar-/sorbitol-6-/2-deoxyglucose-6-phosphatase
MDGIIIDSEPYWRIAIPEVLSTIGIKLNKKQAMQTTGLRVEEVVHYWYKRHALTEPSPDTVALKITERVIDYIMKYGKMIEGLKQVFSVVQTRGIPIALASSSRYMLIDAVVDTLDIRRYFDVIYSAEEEPYGKPHPGVYLSAARKLEIPPYACLAVEDSLAGVIAAKAARMACIAKPEHYPDHDKGFCIADKVVESLYAIDEKMLREIESERSDG